MPGAKARLKLDGADPINRGLSAFWPLRDNAGLIAANLTRQPGTDGALSNGPTWTARGLSLAGTNQYVTVADNAAFDLSGGQSTVSLWIRGTYASQVNYGALIAKGTGSNNWGLYRDFNTTNLNIFVNNDASFANFPGAYGAIMDGNLRHVVWVQSGGSARLYIDGVLNNTQVLPSPNNTSSPVYLGAGWSGVVPHIGQIGNYRVFKRALTPTEVTRLYRDPWAGTARPVRRAVPVPGTQYTLATDALAYEHTVGDAGLGWGRWLDTEALAYEHAVGDAGFVVRRTLQAEAVAYGYTVPAVALNYYPAQAEGDTHDGFKRRSRRQRALDAAERRRREAVAQEAVTLRLSLEAAMGMAAEVVEEAPAEAVEAVQAVARKAARLVPTLADTRADEALLASAREAVAALRAAVDEAARAKALAEDDEDVLMLLRAL